MAVCDLCPFLCELAEGQVGKCRVRGGHGGGISLLTYGQVTTMIDGPIEQKPIYHFHPGMKVLSIGSSGCNMFCGYCQNFEISQTGAAEHEVLSPDDVVEKARESGCRGIAFTYSEPVVWYEYVMDVAAIAKRVGLKTILKTNAYANERKFDRLLDRIDAINIDIKGSALLYRDVAGIDLPKDPNKWIIMRNLASASRKCHLEASTIAIPPYCTDGAQVHSLFSAMNHAAGRKMPLHILRFIPDFKMRHVPATTLTELNGVRGIATSYFDNVYVDYAGVPAVTKCLECGHALIERNGADIVLNELLDGGKCPACKAAQNIG